MGGMQERVKSGRGRPRGRVISQTRLAVRVPQEVKEKIIRYCASRSDAPTESNVIRLLIERGMKDLGI